jgi:hypothetical protein
MASDADQPVAGIAARNWTPDRLTSPSPAPEI